MKSPFYKKRFKDIASVDSVTIDQVPFLTNEDLLAGTERFLTCALDQISYIYCSSGSFHAPKIFYYSKNDLWRMADLTARFSRFEGVSPGDCVLLLLPMRMWVAGPVTMYGHVRAGASVIPLDVTSSFQTKESIINLMEPNIISSMPSLLLDLVNNRIAHEFKIIETTGEPLSDQNRKSIENALNGQVYDAYGLAECIVGVECTCHDGYHYWPDSVIVEIIDPRNTTPVADGEEGEIVVTNFINTTMPIIRYRTGDLGCKTRGFCKCGSDLPRVWVKGRIKSTVFLPGGVKITQGQIIKVLDLFPNLTHSYQLVISDQGIKTRLEFFIESNHPVAVAELEDAFSQLSADFMDLVESNLIILDFQVVDLGSLPRSPISNKIINTIVDNRRRV